MFKCEHRLLVVYSVGISGKWIFKPDLNQNV